MIKFFKILFFIIIPNLMCAQVAENSYRIFFTDKNHSNYTIENPLEFLSQKAIDRRIRQNIEIVENDLPVSKYYIDSLKNLGLTVLNESKWFNSAVIYSSDQDLIDTITSLEFIKSVQKSQGKLSTNEFLPAPKEIINNNFTFDKSLDYGEGETQISMINGLTLHNAGYKGQNMTIAVIDAGFYNVDILPAFDSLWLNNQILGIKDFVDKDVQVFDASNHGMKVLSVIGGNIPGQLIGTAPKAKFWLLRSEQTASEFSIEEDNWVAAAEFADSVGVDIINSSLGYSEFDDTSQNYHYSDMDGNTTFVTKGADMAASKGILVVNSAGNLGDDPWKYISAPADADSVLTVGAVDSFATLAYFSSLGPTSDGRIKPNVVAMGYKTAVQGIDGNITYSNGTSVSSPIISGMAACLWQKYPELTNMEIIEKIEQSSHQYSNPDNEMGYGIPDFGEAAELENINLISVINNGAFIETYPNPFIDNLTIEILLKNITTLNIEIYSSSGTKIKEINTKSQSLKSVIKLSNLGNYPAGIYILKIKIDNQYITKKISKIN